MQQLEVVIFTDMDGTLLDRLTYSYDKALDAVELLRKKQIPVVFCSAKTRTEQEMYRHELGLFHPFIVENGGGIFIPEGYFQFDFNYDKEKDGYQIIELGTPYREIRRILEKMRIDTQLNFRGFGDMSADEVAADSGLDIEAAKRAKEREYDETIKVEDGPEKVDRVLRKIKEAGLNYVAGGRYYDIMGANDKGKATRILIDLFRKKFVCLKTVGIGDSANDLPMLLVVDIPILVQKAEGEWEKIDMPHLRRAGGIGPEGWTRAVEGILEARSINELAIS